MSDKALSEYAEAVRAWTRSLPKDCVSIVETNEPEDEYGSDVAIEFKPSNQNSCDLTLRLVRGSQPCAGIELGSWSKIGMRLNAKLAKLGIQTSDFVALYIEPTAIPKGTVVDICDAVAKGRVHLELGLVKNTLVCTKGFVVLPSGRFDLHGVGGPLFLNKVLSWIHLGKVSQLYVEPW